MNSMPFTGVPKFRSSFTPRTRATLWQGRLVLPPQRWNLHQRQALPTERLKERCRTFGARLSDAHALNARSQRMAALRSTTATTTHPTPGVHHPL